MVSHRLRRRPRRYPDWVAEQIQTVVPRWFGLPQTSNCCWNVVIWACCVLTIRRNSASSVSTLLLCCEGWELAERLSAVKFCWLVASGAAASGVDCLVVVFSVPCRNYARIAFCRGAFV
jgi:hypothetical protein